MDWGLFEAVKSIGEVVVPWVVVPVAWYAWRIAEEMRALREARAKDREDSVERYHALELRQKELELAQRHAAELSTQQRDQYHEEVMRRLDELTEEVKAKADK